MGFLSTVLFKTPLLLLAAGAHPAGYIVAPGVDHLFHLYLSGAMVRQAVFVEARRCSDLAALRRDNAKKTFHLPRELDGLVNALARWIHIAKFTKEAELLNVFDQR